MKTSIGIAVGDTVYDCLTKKEAKVIGIKYEEGSFGDNETSVGCWGIWVDNDWCGGARHPWEITKIKE